MFIKKPIFFASKGIFPVLAEMYYHPWEFFDNRERTRFCEKYASGFQILCCECGCGRAFIGQKIRRQERVRFVCHLTSTYNYHCICSGGRGCAFLVFTSLPYFRTDKTIFYTQLLARGRGTYLHFGWGCAAQAFKS